MHAQAQPQEERLQNYLIRGRIAGRNRLRIIGRVLAPTTARLLDRIGPIEGARVLDVGCGGGEVSLELARRVGPRGHVLGIDLDDVKLDLAREDAAADGLTQVRFEKADVGQPWPTDNVQLVYARFILTHMNEPDDFLAHAMAALVPGGRIVMEDIDYAGCFSDPALTAVERANALYVKAAHARGGNPFIGRQLDQLLSVAGFAGVGIDLVQPFSRNGEAKMPCLLTTIATADGVVKGGLASRTEMDLLIAELEQVTAREDTAISCPRIFQAWGRKPG
jgi:2-polyprenyl-3-methyl-5-hydroxy-6-metoxy-1,4-benzoquinol methylase